MHGEAAADFIVEPPLRVDSTAPRMGFRWLAREARPNQRLQRTPAAQTSFVPRPPLIHGADRPIRIRCRNQWPPEPQLIEIAPILVDFSGKSMAYYTDRKLKIRILCGSI